MRVRPGPVALTLIRSLKGVDQDTFDLSRLGRPCEYTSDTDGWIPAFAGMTRWVWE